jgi:hypothetical protein
VDAGLESDLDLEVQVQSQLERVALVAAALLLGLHLLLLHHLLLLRHLVLHGHLLHGLLLGLLHVHVVVPATSAAATAAPGRGCWGRHVIGALAAGVGGHAIVAVLCLSSGSRAALLLFVGALSLGAGGHFDGVVLGGWWGGLVLHGRSRSSTNLRYCGLVWNISSLLI